MLKMI